MGLALPDALVPNATYVPVRREGRWIYVSGQLPLDAAGNVVARGRLGETIDVTTGQECARRCALNLLAQLSAATADLDRVSLVKLQVYVASTPAFDEQHIVANGASDLLERALGELGRHARSAFGVASLPFGSPVELDAVAVLFACSPRS
jgi:enamine deaminase RidA (YjgF/YER057c/UK114 family)